MCAAWLPDLFLPLGDSDDGRILARFGLQARNFWELGLVRSRFGALLEPYTRFEYNILPGDAAPLAAFTYAHHPPLQVFAIVASVGVFGDNLVGLRMPGFMMGAATIVFMAALLRVRRLAWGPILLSVAAMASSGFFYVYGRIGVGYSLIVASIAATFWLSDRVGFARVGFGESELQPGKSKANKHNRPSSWVVGGGMILFAFTAMQSWIALASLMMLMFCVFFGWVGNPKSSFDGSKSSFTEGSLNGMSPQQQSQWRSQQQLQRFGLVKQWFCHGIRKCRMAKRSPVFQILLLGVLLGGLVTAFWVLNATDIAELIERVRLRTNSNSAATGTAAFTFTEFLARQWDFVSEFTPLWLRLLGLPVLLIGLIDRRTRIAVAVTALVAAFMTFGLQQGAWTHRLWNFPWLAPVTLGLAASFDLFSRMTLNVLTDTKRSLKNTRHTRRKLIHKESVAALTIRSAGFGVLLLIVWGFIGLLSGDIRHSRLTGPAEAGAILQDLHDEGHIEGNVRIWTLNLGSSPLWVSYILDEPVGRLVSENEFEHLSDDDLVMIHRNRRIPDFARGSILPEALENPVVERGEYLVVHGKALLGEYIAGQ